MSQARVFVKNAGFLFGAEVISNVLSLLLVFVIARELGDAGLGRYTFAISFASLFLIFSEFGIMPYIVREVAADRSRAPRILADAALLKGVVGIAACAISVLAVVLSGQPTDVVWLVGIASVAMFFNYFTYLFRSFFQAFEIMEFDALAKVVERVLGVGLGILAIGGGMGIQGVLLAQVVAFAGSMCLSLIITARKIAPLRFSVDVSAWRKIVRGAMPFWLTAVFWVVYFRIDSVMLFYLAGDAQTGLYTAGYKLIEALMFVPTIFVTAAYPVLSRLYAKKDAEHFNLLFDKCVYYLFVLGLPLLVGGWIVASRTILFVYGPGFSPSIIVFQLLLTAAFLLYVGALNGYVLNAMRKEAIFAKALAIASVINIVCNAFAIPRWGIVAYLVFLLAIERRALRELLRSGVMFGVAAMLFALFPIGAHLVGSGLAGEVGVHATRYFSGFFQQDWVNVLSILAQAIVLISPLLIGLLAMGVWKFDRKDMPFFIVIGALAFFYLFVTTASYRPFERYWMPMIPFIAIIGGRILGAEKLIRWPRVAAYTLVAFVGMLALSLALRPVLYPLFPKDEYLRRLFSFDWNFLFPFHGASGPLAFFVSFIIVIASFFVCGIFVLLWLRNGKKQWMVSFIVIAVAFNFLLIGELLYSVSTPDMNYASARVLSFAREEGIVEPLFIYQAIGLAEFNKTGITPRLFFGAQYQNADVARAIENEAGTILLVDFPSASRTSPLWRALETCDIRETVISRGREVGYVFSCQK